MTIPQTTRTVWRRSSRSGSGGGQCVELAADGRIRDSKNPGGPVLTFTPQQLAAFLNRVKAS